MTRKRSLAWTVLASFTRRAMAARISSSCQAPKPPGPMNTAQVGAIGQRGLHGSLTEFAGDQVPLVEPGLDPLAPQPDSQLLDGRLVGGAVREEDVVFEAGHDDLLSDIAFW